MSKSIIGSLFVVIALISNSASSISLSLNVEHDVSGPTYGLQQPTSSQLTYDQQHGLSMKGTVNDILGPPIKIANGFNNMLTGSGMAGVGSSLKSGGAVLGFDAKLLEAAGGANLLKGGLLMGHVAGKKALATAMAGLPGKKIASVIEVPVKVVAMKDIAAGKALKGLGAAKENEANAATSKGQALLERGSALKQQGLNQVIEGANEGMQNLGNMVQQTANNAATAFKFLPLVLDMEQQQQQEQIKEGTKSAGEQHHQQQQHVDSSLPAATGKQASPVTGGSMFGGLASFLGGGGSSAGSYTNPMDPLGLFSGHHHHGYAAVMNSSSPLTNLLMNPGLNPFVYPMASGPLGQSLASKQPAGFESLFSHQQPQQQQHQQQHQQPQQLQHQQQEIKSQVIA